jgi:hypothetical protein
MWREIYLPHEGGFERNKEGVCREFEGQPLIFATKRKGLDKKRKWMRKRMKENTVNIAKNEEEKEDSSENAIELEETENARNKYEDWKKCCESLDIRLRENDLVEQRTSQKSESVDQAGTKFRGVSHIQKDRRGTLKEKIRWQENQDGKREREFMRSK